MKGPSTSDLRLMALVVLLSWPMQLHMRHVPYTNPWTAPGFSMLVYLGWSLAVVGLLYGEYRRAPLTWLVAAGAGTLWMAMAGVFKTWTNELFAVGCIGLATAIVAATWSGIRARDFGLGPGRWRAWAPWTAAGMLLAVVTVQVGSALSPELLAFYPTYAPARHSLWRFVLWELAMVVYMICWEGLWRGTFLFGARRDTSDVAAILLQAIPFFLLHHDKPELEMASSIVGGIMLGWFCLWARSFWPAAILHATLFTTMELTGAFHHWW